MKGQRIAGLRGVYRLVCTLVLAVSALVPAGCSENKRLDVDSAELMPGGVTSQDFRSICSRMAQSMIRLPQIQEADSPPTIAFAEVTNKSDELLDTDSYLEKIRTQLIRNSQGRLVFLDRELVAQILEEKANQEAGVLSGSAEGTPLSADYFLAGTITGIRKAQGRESTSYMRFAFRLTDVRNSVIIWEDEYEVKTYHKAGTYDR